MTPVGRQLDGPVGERHQLVEHRRADREQVGCLQRVHQAATARPLHERVVVLLRHRRGLHGQQGGERAYHEVDVVLVDELGVDLGGGVGVAVVVVVDQLDRAAEQPAVAVHRCGPQLVAEQAGLPVGGECAGQRLGEADRDGIAGGPGQRACVAGPADAAAGGQG